MSTVRLTEVPLQKPVQIVSLELPLQEIARLRSVGIEQGGRVQVLRTGWGQGPLHVRLAHGGEFGLDRILAQALWVMLPVESSTEGG